jgi:hypothetical protein
MNLWCGKIAEDAGWQHLNQTCGWKKVRHPPKKWLEERAKELRDSILEAGQELATVEIELHDKFEARRRKGFADTLVQREIDHSAEVNAHEA